MHYRKWCNLVSASVMKRFSLSWLARSDNCCSYLQYKRQGQSSLNLCWRLLWWQGTTFWCSRLDAFIVFQAQCPRKRLSFLCMSGLNFEAKLEIKPTPPSYIAAVYHAIGVGVISVDTIIILWLYTLSNDSLELLPEGQHHRLLQPHWKPFLLYLPLMPFHFHRGLVP